MQILLPDPPALWRARGFSLDGDALFKVGQVGLRASSPELGLRAPLAPGAAGLPIEPDADAGGPSEHPNGALAVDHLVVLTPDLAATTGDLAAAGADLRREAGGINFLRVGPLIIEVAAARDEPRPRFWGLTFTVPALPSGDGYGEARDAVQPGRRIVTARGGATAVAFITPRPPR